MTGQSSRSNLLTSLFVSVIILAAGFFVNHNKVAFAVLAVFLFAIDLNSHIFKIQPSKTTIALKAGVCLFLFGDLAYTFYLQYHAPLDGDFAPLVLPSDQYKRVLTDPFGFSVLLHHASYSMTNRFFVQWSTWKYFNTLPFLFRHAASPIDSIYLSCALAKTLIKLFLVYLFSVYISGSYRVFGKDFLLAALLVTPLLQACGFVWQIGIVDPSVTFAFAYALSAALFFLFFMPFFMLAYHHRPLQIGYPKIVLLLLFLPVIAFFGPLNAPLIIILCPSVLLYHLWSGMKKGQGISVALKSIPKSLLITFTFATLAAVYSFYIGTHNDENFIATIPLWERYAKIPHGIYAMFSHKGLYFQVLLIAANLAFLFLNRGEARAKKLLRLFLWIVLFSIVFTLLLPLGGYRYYRQDIVRRDTMLPVLMAIIMFYGISTFYVLRHIASPEYKKAYSGVLAMLLLFFAVSNTTNKFDNSCEKSALQQIADSKEKVVEMNSDCTVLSWKKITDYKDSKMNTDLLLKFGVISEEKYYYQK